MSSRLLLCVTLTRYKSLVQIIAMQCNCSFIPRLLNSSFCLSITCCRDLYFPLWSDLFQCLAMLLLFQLWRHRCHVPCCSCWASKSAPWGAYLRSSILQSSCGFRRYPSYTLLSWRGCTRNMIGWGDSKRSVVASWWWSGLYRFLRIWRGAESSTRRNGECPAAQILCTTGSFFLLDALLAVFPEYPRFPIVSWCGVLFSLWWWSLMEDGSVLGLEIAWKTVVFWRDTVVIMQEKCILCLIMNIVKPVNRLEVAGLCITRIYVLHLGLHFCFYSYHRCNLLQFNLKSKHATIREGNVGHITEILVCVNTKTSLGD